MLFTPNELKYDRIYDAQPMKGVCLFGGNFDPRDYSIVYCGAYFHNLYRLEEDGNGGYKGVLQKEFIDKCLQNIADSGRTTVFRPVAAEGNHKFDPILAGILEDAGQMYSNRWNQKYPNWDNDFLHECFLDFIKQFGEAFDGDPRLLCVQIGLYGSFGEWNYCDVMPEHQALVTMSAEKQEALVAQYCKYFKKTKLQHRNPTMGNSPAYPVGFHDDNFVFNSAEYHTPTWDEMIDRATICDGAVEGEWYELHQFDDFFREKDLWKRYKTEMMGAEISGVMAFKDRQGEYFFGPMFEGEALNALLFCTTHFHMTFSLGFQRGGGGVPEKGTEAYKNFRYAASLFGYDFTLKDVSFDDNKLTCEVKNVGIAPIYYDWDVELSLVNEAGEEVWAERQETKLSDLMPMLRQKFTFDLSGAPTGEYKVRFRIINPLECPEDVRYPLIMSNLNREGEYAIAGKLTV